MLGLPLGTIVMLGPILGAVFWSRYVRSVSRDFVMLGPLAKALFFPCYVRSVSGDFVMLGSIAEALFFLVMLGPFQETLLC